MSQEMKPWGILPYTEDGLNNLSFLLLDISWLNSCFERSILLKSYIMDWKQKKKKKNYTRRTVKKYSCKTYFPFSIGSLSMVSVTHSPKKDKWRISAIKFLKVGFNAILLSMMKSHIFSACSIWMWTSSPSRVSTLCSLPFSHHSAAILVIRSAVVGSQGCVQGTLFT